MSKIYKRSCLLGVLLLTIPFLSSLSIANTPHKPKHRAHKSTRTSPHHKHLAQVSHHNPSHKTPRPSTHAPTTIMGGMNAIINSVSPHAQLGVIVQTIDGSQTLYKHNADSLFTPASVNKLFVAVASLDYLKSDYRFETRLRATGQINQSVLNGDLYVQFTGDPTLTDKQLTRLLKELNTLSIVQIKGHVYLDNTAYGSAAYAPGWVLHDLIFGYAAPLNAVIINENRFAIILSPSSQTGGMARVATTVPSGVARVENHTITNARRAECPLSVYSDSDNTYHVNGCIAQQPGKQYFELALRDPVTYAKALIANTLTQNGIRFDGPIDIGQAPAHSIVLTTHQSPSLNLIVKEMLKRSDNLYTNSVLKQIGRVYYRTQGTWQNGLSAIKQILGKPAGIDFNQGHLFDGSGLSRYNLVSPQQLARLLHYAYTNPEVHADLWNALPIAGQDGTLRGRLLAFAKGDPIHAKTGTMKNAGVSALAGYIKSRHHGLLAFVIMTNGLEDTGHVYKNTEDRICKLLLTAP